MDDQTRCTLIRKGLTDKTLNDLYRDFPMIRRLIRSQGGNLQDAEDIFQEALIIFVKKVRKSDFVLTSKLSTYLFGICRLLWKEEQRRQKGLVVGEAEEMKTELTGSEMEAFLRDQEQEDRARLAERALLTLKDRCRELLILFYEGRWKLKEIAARMGYRTEEAAKNQKYKCLESARNSLNQLKQTIQTF